MNNKYIYPLLFTILLLAGACHNKNKEAVKEEAMSSMNMAMMNPWETVTIVKSNPQVMLKLAGELKPDQHTELFAKVNSYVKSVRVDIGDKVIAGQTLILLEAPEVESQVATAKAKLEAQEAIYAATKATFDRMMNANQTKGAIAKDALDQINARLLADEAQWKASKSAYNEIKYIYNYLVIKAPFSGTITLRNIDIGAYVGPTQKEPLLVLENNSKLRLSLSIPEANSGYVNLGDTVDFYVRSQPQKKYKALIRRKSGSLDLKLRSEKIEADFINSGNLLKPYMIAETLIPLQHSEETFFVPKTAVVESGKGVYVIVVKNGKTLHIPVSKGRIMGETIEIFGDLNSGDHLLKMGAEEIQEGTVVPST